MSTPSPFAWQGTPSQIAHHFPAPAAPALEPKRMHFYALATPADEALESEIKQVSAEVERHFNLAQVGAIELRTTHRAEARRLAAKMSTLILSRSAEYVARLERERGLV